MIGGFTIPANIDLDSVQSPIGYTFWFLSFAFGVLCDIQDLSSQIPCQNSILFSSALFFLVLGKPIHLSGDHTLLIMD
jgi:hypothetical protein